MGVWKSLLLEADKTQEEVGAVVKGFEEAIMISFRTNPVRHITQDEVKRRFNICCKVFENLRGDLRWTISKCVDYIPAYLKCELDGVPYKPEEVGRRWNPDNAEMGLDLPEDPDDKYVIKV
jgi:hypothetical protein